MFARQVASEDVSGGTVQAATVLSLGTKSMLQEWMVLGVAKLTRAAVEVVGKERRPAAGASRRRQNDVSLGRNAGSLWRRSGVSHGGLGVALPCACAKRSRLPPEVFGDCSYFGCRLSLRDGAIIRELNETAFALNFPKTGGIGRSESCEKVEYSILSPDLASPALRCLHSVISDIRHQVVLSPARRLSANCSRAVPLEVVR